MVQAGASPVRPGLVKGGSKSVPSLRDSAEFSTLPSTPPSATCWARLSRAYGAGSYGFLLHCQKTKLVLTQTLKPDFPTPRCGMAEAMPFHRILRTSVLQALAPRDRPNAEC